MSGTDQKALVDETALKLIFGGVGGAVAGWFFANGLRSLVTPVRPTRKSAIAIAKAREWERQRKEEAKGVTIFVGSVLFAWGIKQYFDVDKRLAFLLSAEAEPPSPSELADLAREQAAKIGEAVKSWP